MYHRISESLRPARLPDGTRVRIRSEHFAEEADATVEDARWDDGWLYRVDVPFALAGEPHAAPQALDAHRNADGELWVWDFEVQRLDGAAAPAAETNPGERREGRPG